MEPQPNLARRSQFGEFREDHANGADDGFVRIETHFTVLFSPNEAHRQTAAQFAACGFIANSTLEPGAKNMEFGLGHDAFQAEK